MRALKVEQPTPSTASRPLVLALGLLSMVVLPALLCACADQPASRQSAAADEKKLKAADVRIDNASLLAFLKGRSLGDEDGERVEILIAELGASSLKVRAQATKDLIAKGPAVLAALNQGLAYPDQEVQRRCEICIKEIKDSDHRGELAGSVVRLLGARHPAGTAEALLAYLPFADNDGVVDNVREVLTRLANAIGADASSRKAAVHKALLAALTDKQSVRRVTAAEAIVQAGAMKDHKKAVEALLRDRDAVVRGRVAMVLVQAREKEAVPVLIDSLTEVTQLQALEIEETLCRLVGPSAPPVSLGKDAADRVKFHDAWDKWWKDNGAGVNFAALGKPVELGWTTMILLDDNCVIEVDGRKNIRWRIDNLEYPLDVQVLGNGRVLIAEHYGHRITERNFAGQILWQTKCPDAQVAQRLPNGNTFMASKMLLTEIDPNGDTVFSYAVTRPLGPTGGIMKCVKQPSGVITCLYSDGLVMRMDASGRELSSFRVEVGNPLFGGRLQELPNGNVLIPSYEDKVSEYDGNKEVWKVKVRLPIVASRLANGNTLVTSSGEKLKRAVEFTPAGVEVWEYSHPTRVTRAVRR